MVVCGVCACVGEVKGSGGRGVRQERGEAGEVKDKEVDRGPGGCIVSIVTVLG